MMYWLKTKWHKIKSNLKDSHLIIRIKQYIRVNLDGLIVCILALLLVSFMIYIQITYDIKPINSYNSQENYMSSHNYYASSKYPMINCYSLDYYYNHYDYYNSYKILDPLIIDRIHQLQKECYLEKFRRMEYDFNILRKKPQYSF